MVCHVSPSINPYQPSNRSTNSPSESPPNQTTQPKPPTQPPANKSPSPSPAPQRAPPPPSANTNTIPSSAHPLEARLLAWRQTQDSLKMEGLRRAYGIAEPVRRGMELKIVRDGTFKPAVLGGGKGGNVHEDILVLGGRDTEVGWEDVFQGDEFKEPPAFHDEMEKRLRMD
ncbi:hypothetical protein SI65_06621 [Aspergillus cristatus]|uniref:Proteasome maturation factor UMP1 n=1 Tax=Aspergillus cristatus TaxID=573508 RepID=A0A1E3BA23_ASPCR|nr:hypothetical protein SI65_06621 [Aspergillus cristatus]